MRSNWDTSFQVKFEDIVNLLKDWYGNYTRKYPQYNNFIKMVEIVSEEGVEDAVRNDTFRSLVEKAITVKPNDVKIYVEPDQGVCPYLAWNSDFYQKKFEEEYQPIIVYKKEFNKNRDFLIAIMEYNALLSGMLKLAISAVANNYIRELLGIYNMPLEEALKISVRVPFDTIIDRVRKNYYVPVIRHKGLDDEIDVSKRPNSINVDKYRKMIETYQEEAPIEIRLSPEEIEEEITRRLLDEIVADDYEEIDS